MLSNNQAIYILPVSKTLKPSFQHQNISSKIGKKTFILTQSNLQKNLVISRNNNQQKLLVKTSGLSSSSSSANQNQKQLSQKKIKVLKEKDSLKRIIMPHSNNQKFQKKPVNLLLNHNNTKKVDLQSNYSILQDINQQNMANSNNKKLLIDIDEVSELLGNCNEFSLNYVPRKRERLTHLSPEEKLNRRKMKNRVAAQTARDRKKERTIQLENTVKALIIQTNQLKDENRMLIAENNSLKKRIYQSDKSTAQVNNLNKDDVLSLESNQQKDCLISSFEKIESVNLKKTFESAEFIYEPRQRDQVFQKMTLNLKFNAIVTILKTILILLLTKIQFPLIPQWIMIYKKFLMTYSTQMMIPILILINSVMMLSMMNLSKIKIFIQIYLIIIITIQTLGRHLHHLQHNQHIRFLHHYMNHYLIQISIKINKNNIHKKLLTHNAIKFLTNLNH